MDLMIINWRLTVLHQIPLVLLPNSSSSKINLLIGSPCRQFSFSSEIRKIFVKRIPIEVIFSLNLRLWACFQIYTFQRTSHSVKQRTLVWKFVGLCLRLKVLMAFTQLKNFWRLTHYGRLELWHGLHILSIIPVYKNKISESSEYEVAFTYRF